MQSSAAHWVDDLIMHHMYHQPATAKEVSKQKSLSTCYETSSTDKGRDGLGKTNLGATCCNMVHHVITAYAALEQTAQKAKQTDTCIKHSGWGVAVR
jgi:hypothetical protein